MKMHSLLLTLFSVLSLLSAPVLAYDEDDAEASVEVSARVTPSDLKQKDLSGLVLMAEITSLDLPEEDDLFIFRGLVGYTFEPGVQIGGHFNYFRLDKPSVLGQTTENACGYLAVCPPGEELQEDFVFWGFGPMAGYNLEIIEDIFGFQFATFFSFPVTTGSAGWSFEAGAYAYLSMRWIHEDFGLALMGGGHFGHFDFEIDHYRFIENRMMPVAGAMWQF